MSRASCAKRSSVNSKVAPRRRQCRRRTRKQPACAGRRQAASPTSAASSTTWRHPSASPSRVLCTLPRASPTQATTSTSRLPRLLPRPEPRPAQQAARTALALALVRRVSLRPRSLPLARVLVMAMLRRHRRALSVAQSRQWSSAVRPRNHSTSAPSPTT